MKKLIAAALAAFLTTTAQAQIKPETLWYCEDLFDDAFAIAVIYQNPPVDPEVPTVLQDIEDRAHQARLLKIMRSASQLPAAASPWDKTYAAARFSRDEFFSCLMDFGIYVE